MKVSKSAIEDKDLLNKIRKPLNHGNLLLWIGIPLTILSPTILLSFLNASEFTETGAIGDTIGGITSPFINIIGAILVFLALKAQIEANIIVQKQIAGQQKEKKFEQESFQINKLYENLKSSIDNFTYKTLDPWELRNEEKIELKGSEAFYQLFQDFYCDAHLDEESLKSNPKITEIISILEICDTILIKTANSKIADQEILKLLTMHQFIYRIFPKLSFEYPNNLDLHYCESCKKDHGLPQRIIALVKSIREKCTEKIC